MKFRTPNFGTAEGRSMTYTGERPTFENGLVVKIADAVAIKADAGTWSILEGAGLPKRAVLRSEEGKLSTVHDGKTLLWTALCWEAVCDHFQLGESVHTDVICRLGPMVDEDHMGTLRRRSRFYLSMVLAEEQKPSAELIENAKKAFEPAETVVVTWDDLDDVQEKLAVKMKGEKIPRHMLDDCVNWVHELLLERLGFSNDEFDKVLAATEFMQKRRYIWKRRIKKLDA